MSRPMLGSRKRINAEQYKIENVRTTNLCLAGLDILRAVPNVLVIATSSMDTMTDDGHLDRCSIKANLSLLKVPERYEVPRRQFQSYPDASSIHCASVLPIHRDTVLHDLMAGETKDDSPGSHFSIWRGSLETGVFGRFVVNVVTHAQMGHIRHSTCDFFTAVGAVLRCIKQHFRKRSRDDADEPPDIDIKSPVEALVRVEKEFPPCLDWQVITGHEVLDALSPVANNRPP